MGDLFESKNISPMLLNESEPFDDENYIFELNHKKTLKKQ